MGSRKLDALGRYGRYTADYELASGGMAAVLVGHDPVLLREVAIKVLHDKYLAKSGIVDRFFQEARTVAQLRSPHIVEVHDFGQEGNYPYLVMEYVDGLNLWGILDSLYPRPMDPIVAAALICQAAEGLEAASKRGVIHRDIKPENLLVSPEGYLKIADFGISHVKDHTITRTGAVVGTAQYMSPEQAAGEKGITFQSDMFSLGTVFYVCLTGVQPFQTETFAGTIRKIVSEPHRPILEMQPSLDGELAHLVEVLLQKDPMKRGNGPRWLKTKLKEYLYKKQVTDPVARIKEYLGELSGQGIKTTGFISPLLVAASRGSRAQAPLPPAAASTGWGLKVSLGALGVLFLVAGAILWSVFTRTTEPAAPATVRATPPPAVQAPQVTPTTLPATASEAPKIQAAQRHERAPSRPRDGQPNPNPMRSPATAAKAPATAKKNAYISIQSSPPFAEIQFDGEPAGTTPLQGAVVPGRHRISLEAVQLNAKWDTVIDIPAGEHKYKFRIPGAFE